MLVLAIVLWRASLTNWAGNQVLAIINAHIVPEIKCADVDYRAPKTVVLRGLEVVAPDDTPLITLEEVLITLGEIPRRGKPLVIETVSLHRGTVRLIQDEKGLKGLIPLVAPKEEREEINEDQQLSNVLRLNHVAFDGVDIVFEPEDLPPMTLNGFELDMAIEAELDERDGRVWHGFDIATGREPGLTLEAKGRLHLDSSDLDLERATFDATVNPETISSLPPAMQKFLQTANASGQLQGSITGLVSPKNSVRTNAFLRVVLSDFRMAAGDLMYDVPDLDIDMGVSAGVIDLQALNGEVMGGFVGAVGNLAFTHDRPSEGITWTIDNVDLGRLEKRDTSDGAASIAGIVKGEGTIAFDTESGKIANQGEFHIRDGNFGRAKLARSIDDNVTSEARTGRGHRADAEFTLKSDHVEFQRFEVVLTKIAARGKGTVGFDGSIDMILNAGPLEKLQSMLGLVGNWVATVTDVLVKYRVSGKLGEPKVSVIPLSTG